MTLDRLLEPLKKIVDALTRRVDYHAFYQAQVVAQNPDGTLDLQPTDSRWPGMQYVPILYGVPGVSAKVSAGATIGFGFLNESPSAPYVPSWAAGSAVTNLTLNATQINLNTSGGTPQAARNGDQVSIPASALNSAFKFDPGTSGATASFMCAATGTIITGSSTVGIGPAIAP